MWQLNTTLHVAPLPAHSYPDMLALAQATRSILYGATVREEMQELD